VLTRGNGYDVIVAKDGQEAIEMVMREHPDLILLDVNMPGMSGLEACSTIRLSFSGPIIMVSVRNSEQDKFFALDSGADDYVVKPFAIGELASVARKTRRICGSSSTTRMVVLPTAIPPHAGAAGKGTKDLWL
jgi:DNA-binding response OmpR family regulator